MRRMRRLALVCLLAVAGCAAHRRSVPPTAPETRQFTFAWPFRTGSDAAPRGGTTHGQAVALDTQPGEAWERLHAPGLTPLERDRRAILAMAGTYRASFDFLEVAGFRPGFAPDRPYQSWGTEWVAVVRDEPKAVSLQHLLVMFIQKPDGTVEGPIVTKHWRQDWRYEQRDLLTYRGRNTWAHLRLPASQVKGTWTQSVFQVDDSPRYAAYGRWEHFGNLSTWRSAETWRPLPRREFSVRKDYQVLVGTNRHTITPTGWVQEEDNLKVVLDDAGRPVASEPVVAQELGLNRYERVAGFDDSAARQYAERTGPFWRDVQAAWDEIVRTHERFTLRAAPDQGQLFTPLFEYAEHLADGAPFDPVAARAFARDTVRGYLADAAPAAAAGY
jgi:uncharacterized protein DUF6607